MVLIVPLALNVLQLAIVNFVKHLNGIFVSLVEKVGLHLFTLLRFSRDTPVKWIHMMMVLQYGDSQDYRIIDGNSPLGISEYVRFCDQFYRFETPVLRLCA